MRILSFGSLNFDHVYNTDHFVVPKETMPALSYNRGFGGKGQNQSVAMSKAGLEVFHAGRVGADGQPFVDYLNSLGVNTTYLIKDDSSVTGHAIIEVSGGENRIILFGGANREIDEDMVDSVLSHFSEGDWLVIQNEISSLPYLIEKAKKRSLKILFNAAPMEESVKSYPLDLVDIICVNEIEGKALSGCESSSCDDIGKTLSARYPDSDILLTAGEEGSWYFGRNNDTFHEGVLKVKAVDTTAAGDTYIGYFLAGLSLGKDIPSAMHYASVASALAVQKPGAADSVPYPEEVEKYL